MKFTANDYRVLRAIVEAMEKFGAFIPHGSADWTAIGRCVKRGLVVCVGDGICSTCPQPHEDSCYELTDRGKVFMAREMSEQRRAEIKGRDDRATKGPWRVKGARNRCIVTEEGVVLAYLSDGCSIADGELLAHGREDVRDLLVEVERLRASSSIEKGKSKNEREE